jgi:hypothetical protein
VLNDNDQANLEGILGAGVTVGADLNTMVMLPFSNPRMVRQVQQLFRPLITGTRALSTDPAGYNLALYGSGFTGATAVSVDGTAVTAFTVISDSSLKLTVPAALAGHGNLVVTTPMGANSPAPL